MFRNKRLKIFEKKKEIVPEKMMHKYIERKQILMTLYKKMNYAQILAYFGLIIWFGCVKSVLLRLRMSSFEKDIALLCLITGNLFLLQ